ncbi:serine hydrolase domain-containing protein [Sphingomonas sp. PAMC 26605]|uniref:serine hydrolase domain-containing protein n=1 Tax=Sphingomonas sp. PAMC 26605 TaxID=1112214 RepID=UPI00026CA6BB|nr:serine hydrolase domain-containing protein [Sphingomonas sp. PAMC 26605]
MRFWNTRLIGGLLLLAGATVAQGAPKPATPATSLAPAVGPARAPVAPAPVPNGVIGAHDLTKADLDTWLDGYLPYALRAADIPGAVVTVVKDGKILTARGFGYADVAKRTPVDPQHTLFRIGSVSKLFTWTATMQLVEQHKLDLDADVNSYLDFKIPPRDGKPVTLRQLMTHTGGFEEVAKGVITYDAKRYMPLEQYLKRWTPHRIFAAGTTPAYSNWGTTLAAYIVQRVSHEEFNAYLERHIFAPLAMHDASFRQPLPAHFAANLATGYFPAGTRKGFEYVTPAPAGAGSVSGVDMARFMLAHLQHGTLDGQRILSPQTADLMHDSPLDKVDPRSLIPPLDRMELGFFETNINGREVIGHLGDIEAFHTSLHLFMKEGVGFYVSFNSPGKDGAVQDLRMSMFQDFADRYFPNIAPADGRVDAKTAAEHARMMTGSWIASRRANSSFLGALYWMSGQTQISVGPQGELIVPNIVNGGGRPREWVEIAPFVWRDAYGHDRLGAQVVDGKVVRWSYEFASPFEMFDRVPTAYLSSWLLPALGVSLAILLLTFLQWPAAALVRRTYQARHPLEGAALRASRAVRLMAGLAAALLIAWAVTMISALSSPDSLAGGLDGVFWFFQIAGVVVLFGLPVIAGWNLWMTWRDGRSWTRRVWALLILLAALLILYFALTFNLLALTVNF